MLTGGGFNFGVPSSASGPRTGVGPSGLPAPLSPAGPKRAVPGPARPGKGPGWRGWGWSRGGVKWLEESLSRRGHGWSAAWHRLGAAEGSGGNNVELAKRHSWIVSQISVQMQMDSCSFKITAVPFLPLHVNATAQAKAFSIVPAILFSYFAPPPPPPRSSNQLVSFTCLFLWIAAAACVTSLGSEFMVTFISIYPYLVHSEIL